MRMYLDESVREMAEKRIRWMFEEFDRICVNVSGGKDSTVCFEMAYRIAEEMGELPINILWIDQEAEYQSTVDLVRGWMERDGVNPIWLQVPVKMTNATSDEENYLLCWNPDEEDNWVHEKNDMAIHENTYGTRRFYEMFEEGLYHEVADARDDVTVGAIGGVRAEESPNRYLGMTNHNTHKGVTYGKEADYDNIKTIYPIYDWTYSDVWKYIHENDTDYNDVYDAQYSHGVNVRDMRVSNLNHASGIRHLFWLQEFEPDTWNALEDRLDGVHMAGQMNNANYVPEELPYMFETWREYRNYLLRHVVDDEKHERGFKRAFFTADLMGEHLPKSEYRGVLRGHVRGILTNDWEEDAAVANSKRKISYPHTSEIMKRKKEWLKENRPEAWNQLYEEGVVQHST